MKLNVRKIDTILNNPNHNIILKSISALHIVKSHPFYTDKKYSLGFLFNKIITILFYRNLKYLNYITKNIFFSKKNKISKKKILIISHFVNKEQIGKKNDFYFGHLERILKEKNKSYFKILINHTKYDSNYLNSLNKNKNQIILENYLNFSNEIKKKILKIFTAFNLIKLNLNKEINFLMFKKLILSLFNSQTAFSIRIHYQIQNYIKRFDPEYLILTYEGFSWERMCINGAKKQNKKIKCIGYQHSIITIHF